MAFKEQSDCLRSFLLFKFSMDPQMRCMLPGVGDKRKARNNAQWMGFELTDDEMERLVANVMCDYAQALEAIAQSQALEAIAQFNVCRFS